jgi:SAM-dependent methyltransferase
VAVSGEEGEVTIKALQRLFKRARALLFEAFYSGSGCFCVFCGRSYSKFMHQGARAQVFRKHQIAGGGYRKNARCPNCGSRQRTRLLHLFFQLRTDIYSRSIRLLHVSPNRQLAHWIRGHTNIDYVCGALRPEVFPELDAVRVDVTNIPFEDGEFDVVICNHVLEHVPEDDVAMGEIFRVLAPGGFAVLQVPLALDLTVTLEDPSVAGKRQRRRAYGQEDHLRLYGTDYFEKLERAGFTVVRDSPFRNDWSLDVAKHCLDEDEEVILGRKGTA